MGSAKRQSHAFRPPKADQAARSQAIEDKNRRIAERIARRFGDDKGQGWEEYSHNNRAQQRVRSFATLLETYRLPLQDEQRRALVKVAYLSSEQLAMLGTELTNNSKMADIQLSRARSISATDK